jgi:hypothetical protein
MRFIPTKIHGILDYLMSVVLVTSPWLFSFEDEGGSLGKTAKTLVPLLLGIGTFAYSLLTKYEFGALRKITMRTHLALDLVAGILLAVSPWLFGFADQVYLPHLVLGILEIGAALLTKQATTYSDVKKYTQPVAG